MLYQLLKVVSAESKATEGTTVHMKLLAGVPITDLPQPTQHPQQRVGQTPVATVEALLLVYREVMYLLVHAQIEQHKEYMGIK